MCCCSRLYVRRYATSFLMWQWHNAESASTMHHMRSQQGSMWTSTYTALIPLNTADLRWYKALRVQVSWVVFPHLPLSRRCHVGRAVVYWPRLTLTLTQLCNFDAWRSRRIFKLNTPHITATLTLHLHLSHLKSVLIAQQQEKQLA